MGSLLNTVNIHVGIQEAFSTGILEGIRVTWNATSSASFIDRNIAAPSRA
jgi:hypothetical protein